jgi:DNA processing protein
MVPADNSEARLPTTPDMPSDGIEKVVRGEVGYPARLLELRRPPQEIWYRGHLPPADRGAMAIVGSRKASGAGCERAHELAGWLGRRGWVVVSGGAFGIDAAAHRGALDAGAETYAVLGCGVDVVYPDRHRALFARIAEQGGLISQFAPGTEPRMSHFPQRNEVVSALADAVIVVEAAFRSGALITARLAKKRGQRLLAVPGTPGTDALIAAGTLPVTSPASLDDALAGRASAAPVAPLPAMFGKLIETLRAGRETPAVLARRLGMSLPAVMGLLLEAELEGWVRRAADSHYEVSRVH